MACGSFSPHERDSFELYKAHAGRLPRHSHPLPHDRAKCEHRGLHLCPLGTAPLPLWLDENNSFPRRWLLLFLFFYDYAVDAFHFLDGGGERAVYVGFPKRSSALPLAAKNRASVAWKGGQRRSHAIVSSPRSWRRRLTC